MQGALVSRREDPPSQDRRLPRHLVSLPSLATTNHGEQLGHLKYERRQPSEPLPTNASTLVGVATQAGPLSPVGQQ